MRQLLSKRETADRLGYHPEHLMRLSRAGRFPQPIRLGASPNCAVRFVVDEVDDWLADRMANRDAGAHQ
jgi:predicted DNA-binding transcriptional regulator AlpA